MELVGEGVAPAGRFARLEKRWAGRHRTDNRTASLGWQGAARTRGEQVMTGKRVGGARPSHEAGRQTIKAAAADGVFGGYITRWLLHSLALLATIALATATAVAQSFTEYPIPTASSSPYGIVAGPDGNLWFTESGTNKIGKVTTTGAFTHYSIPTVTRISHARAGSSHRLEGANDRR
jgi:hypothetical protein